MKSFLDILNKIHCFDYLFTIKSMISWCKKPSSLIKLITITSLLAILISSTMFYIDNKKKDAEFSAMWRNYLANKFAEKNDILRIQAGISQIHFPVSTSTYVSLPLEVSTIQQAFDAYSAMKNNISPLEAMYLPSITTIEQYNQIVKVSDIDEANSYILKSFDESKKLANYENILFWILSITQIFNIFFALALFYLEKKLRTSNKEPREI